MGNEIRIPEMEVPQLRQMVLKNTKRIIKNEQTIREMKEKLQKEGLRQLQRETYWDTSREEHDRAHREHEQDMRKLREYMHDHAVQFDADLKKSREEFDASLKKSHEEVEADLKKSREEFDKRQAKSKAEDEERHRKFDEDLKKTREEFNQRQAELDAKAEERHRKFDEGLKKSREEFDASLKKSREEFDASLKKSHEEVEADLKKSREEFDKRMNALDDKISKMTTDFIGSIGHIVEGLAGTKAEEMFTAQGYEISDKKMNLHKKVKFLNKEIEADVALFGPGLIIVIEVKANCTRKDIDKFVDHMKNRFRDLFPEWNNLEMLGAVAAINYEDDADAYAHQNGLLVIRTDTHNVFSLDKSDRETLRRF